ncbi:MAG: JAB domain-containing protein [Lentisphaerae bacterium]|nr:JAB domain-containing protein [Lentisphaerota bacterium]
MTESDPSHEVREVTYPVAPRIKDLPPDLQPREMLERFGPANVPDAVLLAVLLRTGMPKKNVLDLAAELLQRHRSLAELGRASLQELTAVKSIKKVKALTLLAAFELGRRMRDEGLRDAESVRTPADAARLVRSMAERSAVEIFWMLPLNKRNRMITRQPVEISRGILDANLVHQREVFEQAVRTGSAAVVLAHNHPSGDPSPSAEDLSLTRKMVEAGRLLDIRVLDHVIVGRPSADGSGAGFFSLREAGLVDFDTGEKR